MTSSELPSVDSNDEDNNETENVAEIDRETNAEQGACRWLATLGFRRADQACENWLAICRCGVSADLIELLEVQLCRHLVDLDDIDTALAELSQFILASRSPTALLALFERDESALVSLLEVFDTSPTLAKFLINDPEAFDLMRASDGLPAQRRFLVDELVAEMRGVDQVDRAKHVIGNFIQREIVRIAYGEFVRSLSPDQAGRQLTFVAEAALESALDFSIRTMVAESGQPFRIDGEKPRLTMIGLGSFGGMELNYSSPLHVAFLYDAIDEKNPTQNDFYRRVVQIVVDLLQSDDEPDRLIGFFCELSHGPYLDERLICGVNEAAGVLETKNRDWQRIAFVKARVVAGDRDVGQSFLKRVQPWVYHRFMSQRDFDEVRALRHRLERRVAPKSISRGESEPIASAETEDHWDVLRSAGGRHDIEIAIQFLQLLHGADLPSVRVGNTSDAIVALEKDGCLLHAEAELLAANYARLCRLHHQLTVMFGRESSALPTDATMVDRLARRLGVKQKGTQRGDGGKFRSQLAETIKTNRTVINHLMIDAPGVDCGEGESKSSEQIDVETALLLDPESSDEDVCSALTRRGLSEPLAAMQDLRSLQMETVPFLSPRRCRHFLAAIAPKLLGEIAKTPFPNDTLRSLVEVTDSLGAKATLWELLGANEATLDLMVRLCSSAAYLRNILIQNPGMIDELIDSLLMNRLPSGDRLDAQSLELCRGAMDIDLILQGFKNGAHLTIGVRDILNKESIEATHQALSDTAEACLRRMIESEQSVLAGQLGDPMAANGDPAELVAIALGKFGGREPNYHSDLDVIFLYSHAGETKRRVGGPRTTVTNHRFFNQLAQRVASRINGLGGRPALYELDGRLRPTGDEGTLAVSIEEFLKRFQQGVAPLWQRLALCKARCVSGSKRSRKAIDKKIASVLAQTQWHRNMGGEIREMRMRMQETAASENLKRAEGGSVDVEVIAQMLTLRYAVNHPSVVRCNTIESLDALAAEGLLEESKALSLASCYRTLRRIESRLRLLDTQERHDLPSDDRKVKELAFLMNESDPTMITAQAEQARHTIRKIFNQIFDSVDC